MMALADQVCAKLLQVGGAYMDNVLVQHVGVHPENRFGGLLTSARVYVNLQKVRSRGWSASKLAGARAIEVKDGLEGEKQRQINVKIAAASDGMLPVPPANGATIRVLSVASSHTACSLRCINAGCKPPPGFDDVVDANGRLSKDKVIERHPSYADPLENGIRWTIITRATEAACPRIAEFLQEAGNEEHGTEQRQSKLETMMEIQSKAVHHEEVHGCVAWSRIAKQVPYRILRSFEYYCCLYVEASLLAASLLAKKKCANLRFVACELARSASSRACALAATSAREL
jgi:hypothetical protein